MKINMSYLNQLPVQSSALNTIPLAILLVGLADFLIFHGIFDLGRKVYNFLSGSPGEQSFDKSQVEISRNSSKYFDGNKSNNDLGLSQKVQNLIGNEEVEIVFKSLGIFGQPEEGGRLSGRLDSNDLVNIFEDDKARIYEVQEAFEVFDENRDGFIDAEELQRVLIALGFKEGLELENCRRMIRTFDENDDDRIDFHEFVSFMECIE